VTHTQLDRSNILLELYCSSSYNIAFLRSVAQEGQLVNEMRFISILPPSGSLRSVRWFETDVSGLPIRPVLKGQAGRLDSAEVKERVEL
jgi:hypothetical protein